MLPAQVLRELMGGGDLFIGQTQPDPPEQLQPSSVDLHVSCVLAGGGDKPLARHDAERKPFPLRSGQIVTLVSREQVNLPRNAAGILFPPNHVAEQGILAINSGHIDPGYRGCVNLRVLNLSAQDFIIERAMRFATLLVFRLGDVSSAVETDTPYSRPVPSTREEYIKEREEVIRERGQAPYSPPRDFLEDVLTNAMPRLVLRGAPAWAILFLTITLLLVGLATAALVATELYLQLVDAN